MKAKIVKYNPKYIFILFFILLFVVSDIMLKNLNTSFLSIVFIIDFLLFAFYTLIRYIEYLEVYLPTKAFSYLLIDNGFMAIGLLFLYSVDFVLYRETNIINFFLFGAVICFLIPTFIRNGDLNRKWLYNKRK